MRECATANDVTTTTRERTVLKGRTRQARKTSWSMLLRRWSTPSSTKCQAAWCHRGSSQMRPGLPVYSNVRTAPSGGRNRSTELIRTPERSSDGSIEKADRSEPMGYSNRTSSTACSQYSSVSTGSGGASHVCECCLVRDERSVGRQRHSSGRHARDAQEFTVFENLHVGDPAPDGVAERPLGGGQVQKPYAVGRNIRVTDCAERCSDQQAQLPAFRLHQCLHGYVAADRLRSRLRTASRSAIRAPGRSQPRPALAGGFSMTWAVRS